MTAATLVGPMSPSAASCISQSRSFLLVLLLGRRLDVCWSSGARILGLLIAPAFYQLAPCNRFDVRSEVFDGFKVLLDA
jgi:hypothetical protein